VKLPQFVVAPALRRKAKFEHTGADGVCVRPATEERDYEDAFRLVHLGYVYEGIEPIRPLDLRMTEQHVLSEATVLVAYDGEILLGTITVTLDSPAGIPLEKDYPQEMASLRTGAHLAEFGSFALVRRAWGSGVAQHLSLAAFRCAFQLGKATHVVIGIHPRAIPFYKAVWGFEEAGRPRAHGALKAPVVPMVVSREKVISHLARHFPKAARSGLSPADFITRPGTVPHMVLGDGTPNMARWKMSRKVFRRLFVEQTDHLDKLGDRTVRHLRTQRTDNTIGQIRKERDAVA